MKAPSLNFVPLLLLLAACAGSQSSSAASSSARGDNCAIDVVREGVPSTPTRRIGEAVARCRGDWANDEQRCLRELQNRGCALGATVLWDLRSREMDDGGREWRAVAGVAQTPESSSSAPAP